MSSPLNRGALGGARPGIGGLGGNRGPALAPAPAKGKSPRRRWWLWVLLIPLLLLGLTYLAGRLIAPAQGALAKVPAIGQPLFGKPVWPILWNRPAAPPAATATEPAQPAAGNQTGQQTPLNPALQNEVDAAQAVIAAAGAKEQDLAAREAALKVAEAELSKLQSKLASDQAEVAGLKQQLAGQLRTEKDRVEVVRAMSRTSQATFFGALTDDEALAILKYMTADEVAAILGKLDPYRAARLFERLPLVAPTATTP